MYRKTHQQLSLVFATLLVSSSFAHWAAASPRMMFEQEPNGSAPQAHEISGEVHIIGEISPDDEDYFLWVLDDSDADRLWRLELSGEEDVDVQAQFLPPSDIEPEVAASDQATLGVSSFGSADTDEPDNEPIEVDKTNEVWLPLSASGKEKALQNGQLVPAGEYLIRIKSAGKTDGKYQLLLSDDGSPGARLRIEADEDIRPIQEDRNWVYQTQETDIAIPLPGEGDAGQLWRLAVGGELGTPIAAWIATANGEMLTDSVSAPTLQHEWPQEGFAEPAYLHVRHQDSGEAIGHLSVRLEENGRKPETSDEPVVAVQDEAPPPSPAVAEVSQLWEIPSERRPGWEYEPNDQAGNANPFQLGETITGTFHSSEDVDQFQFSLPGENRLALSLEPPEGLRVTLDLYWHQDTQHLQMKVDEPRDASVMLPPGDYTLTLRADQKSADPYRVKLNLAQPWADNDFFLPASDPEQAMPLPEGGRIDRFMGGEPGQGGWVRLPVSDAEREISWEGAVHKSGYAYYTGLRFVADNGDVLTSRSYGLGQGTISIPANTEVLMEVSFGGDAKGATLNDPAWQPMDASPLALNLSAESDTLAAFASQGQKVDITLELANEGNEPQQLPLQYHLSHAAGELSGLPEEVRIAAGERISLPLVLRFPPELAQDAPLALFVRAGEPGKTARLNLKPRTEAAPSQPFVVPDIAPELQGLTNLAWNALGAEFVSVGDGDLPTRHQALIDGLANADYGIDVRSKLGEAIPPIRLAGEGGTVHAIVINQRSPHSYQRRWREVEVLLGNAPDALDSVIKIELEAADGEQIFMLDEPRRARYLQLRPLSIWWERALSGHGTGLLQVLGEPAGELATQRHNLLAAELGGHWVYTLPDLPNVYGLEQFETNRITSENYVKGGQEIRGRTVEMVTAFLQQRAAMLDELHWVDNPDWSGLPIERAEVFTSVTSPAGPWQSQGIWELERDADGVASWQFDTPVRSRYLRLVFQEPAVPEGESSANWRIPQALRAIEAETLANRASILGYWGLDHSRGPLEAQLDPPDFVALAVEDPSSQANRPYLLADSVTGRVAEPGDSRHYQISLEDGDNTLQFSLSASQHKRLQATLLGPKNEPIPLDWQNRPEGGREATVSGLTPGDYHLSLAEPPRSVVFLWDGSASVSHHQSAIYQALNRFAGGLSPGREVFNLMPLGGPLLIDGWADQPEQVAITLAAYDGRFGISNSEPALQMASRALMQEPGEKAIFLMTDAEQGRRDMQAWRTLNEIKPRIFSIEMANGGRAGTPTMRWRRQQMMSWGNIANGSYRYATGRTELVQALEAGMRELRGATTFALTVESRYEEPPQPGSLRVISGDAPVVAGGAIQLIFDASGSMLRQMEGGRRIDVARRVVSQVLDERIPGNVPIALRAFGHTAPHSCETELLVTPQSDNHEQVGSAIAGIQAINLARTPLAASLEAALDDLSAHDDQRRLLIMLTDGEETCDGDLETTVERLVSEGLDLRLNIVGFHIDDLALQAEFERLAALTAGDYFDSSDDDELVQALSAALAANWHLIDSAGKTVAQGRVDGEAISLMPGEYELLVHHHAGEWRYSFQLEAQQNLTLEAMNDGQDGAQNNE